MAHLSILLICLQVALLKEALALPLVGSTLNLPNAITTNTVPGNVLSGTATQIVAPEYINNWPASAQPVPLVTEILPNLQFGEVNVDGEIPVGGMIKVSGSFPVFGSVSLDGTVPSFGTAYVDTGNVFKSDCACV
ncbi:unnamed protein product [Diatraea saccharalis]|uniref:Uncharacterized protein n=1 Tax=Diatraea saccharalis TaxID=40085 RepID=A0A9N9QWN6_9NEOP|nr:unnamed protein product [Diatraea saccharalis]